MYYYVTDKEFIKRIKGLCGNIMKDLCHQLKEDYDIGAIFYMVGSGARNLILQNENNPIDLDYNLEIVRCSYNKDCKAIKENVRKTFNKILKEYGMKDSDDSTSALTTKRIYFTKGNGTEFSMDVAIICRDDKGNMYRLIHEKIGCLSYGIYYWNQAPNSQKLRGKVEAIKKAGMWNEVREQYKNIKNRYLHNNDHNHSSFICYIETINNIYNAI